LTAVENGWFFYGHEHKTRKLLQLLAGKTVNEVIKAMSSSLRKTLIGFILLFVLPATKNILLAQTTVSIDLATAPNVEFSFNTVNKLNYGIVIPNAIVLNVEATGGQWDLYVGSVTTVAGTWDNSMYYTTTGNGSPPVNMLQMRVHNLSGTPQMSGYVPMQDIATSTLDIIGNHLVAPDPAVNCSDIVPTGTNTPGSYTTDPQCYQFRVDLKIVPGIVYRPGLYTLQLEYIIIEDL
jgi:hypothetical protein